MSTTRTARIEELVGCPCTGQTLDKLIQPAVLAVLAEGPLHGYALAERLGALPGFAGVKPDVSGVYRFLKAMQRKRLVVSVWDLSATGPARRIYRLTAGGQRCLQRWVQTLEVYRRSITALLKTARKAARTP